MQMEPEERVYRGGNMATDTISFDLRPTLHLYLAIHCVWRRLVANYAQGREEPNGGQSQGAGPRGSALPVHIAGLAEVLFARSNAPAFGAQVLRGSHLLDILPAISFKVFLLPLAQGLVSLCHGYLLPPQAEVTR